MAPVKPQEPIIELPRDAEAERAFLQRDYRAQQHGEISDATRELYNEIDTIRSDMAQNEVFPATIVNLNPYALHAQGPLVDDIVVPACEPGKSWSLFTVRAYRWDFPDKGGRYGARAILPIVLAKDFCNQQTSFFGRGGVFCYLGDHLPGPKEEAALRQAERELVQKCTELAKSANAEWSRPNGVGKLNVDDRHRKALMALKARRLWNKPDPEWLVEVRSIEDVLPTCPKCGAEPLKGAVECKACGWLVDPIKAWKEHPEMVDFHNQTHKAAFMVLSREQLDEIGLNMIPTAAEYKAMQLAELQDLGSEARKKK